MVCALHRSLLRLLLLSRCCMHVLLVNRLAVTLHSTLLCVEHVCHALPITLPVLL